MYLKPEKGTLLQWEELFCIGHYSTPPSARGTVLDTVILYGMNCTKCFVHKKR